jgi:hypothetical protein
LATITHNEEASMNAEQYDRIGENLRRTFRITFGLRPGYGHASVNPEWKFEKARDAILEWMAGRIEQKQPYLTGTLTPTRILYAYEGDKGQAIRIDEPGAVFQGEVSVLYEPHTPDEEIFERLDELAEHIGLALEQTRVYVSYKDIAWILQQGGKSSPRSK